MALSLGACENAAKKRATEEAFANDSLLTKDNAELQRQKDSLMASMRGLFDAMNAIDSAATLAGVKKETHKGEPIKPYEQVVQERTVKALQRLKVVEARLKASVASVSKLKGQNAAMQSDLDSLRSLAMALQSQAATQQARVDTLMQQLALAHVREDSLTARTQVLATSLDSEVTERQRVYMVVGTKDFLRKNAIVDEVGGTRFPWIVKVGATLRPSNKVDDALFQSFDMMSHRVIDLDPAKRYEVVSSQDLSGADTSNAKGRVFRGSIHITNPSKFWNPSSHLILRTL